MNFAGEGLKLAVVSLGCVKNRIDTEEIIGCLTGAGFTLTDELDEADLVVVNTCAFIDPARRESINTLLQVAADLKPGAKVIASGCLAETDGRALLRALPELNGAIGVHGYGSLKRFSTQILAGRRAVLIKSAAANYNACHPRLLTGPGHSTAVRIAEGCNNCCHYCLIPAIRGPYRSRPVREIIDEIEALLAGGVREICLVAQDTTAYGSDCPGEGDLAALVRKILTLPEHFWLRIMYAYPTRVSDELLELMANESRLCRYLDLPVQHAGDAVLAGMGRVYRRSDLDQILVKIRHAVPGIALRTTCLTGHPGETREQFQVLLDFITSQPFERLGAFACSLQAGTVAATLPGIVPSRVGRRRRSELMALQQKISLALNRHLVGRRLLVLVDRALPGGLYAARSEFQAPEVDGAVFFRSAGKLNSGSWVQVRIAAAGPYNLLAVEAVPRPGPSKGKR